MIIPNVARIRSAVKSAFTADPNLEVQREARSQEGATVWVVNGSGVSGQAADVAAYLEYWGMNVSTPNQRPTGTAPTATRIVAYNGADTTFPPPSPTWRTCTR